MLNPYGTHAELLIQAIRETNGPVVEFGVGWGSTPLLAGLVPWTRQVDSYDTSVDWLKDLSWVVKMDRGPAKHTLFAVKDYLEIEPYPCSVLLIDCYPPEMRGKLFRRWQAEAEWIILHDYETPEVYGYPGPAEVYRIDQRSIPWTALCRGGRCESD